MLGKFKPKKSPHPSDNIGVVYSYSILCKDCDSVCIGQSVCSCNNSLQQHKCAFKSSDLCLKLVNHTINN